MISAVTSNLERKFNGYTTTMWLNNPLVLHTPCNVLLVSKLLQNWKVMHLDESLSKTSAFQNTVAIAGNFWGRKLSQIGWKGAFRGEKFCRILNWSHNGCGMPKNFMAVKSQNSWRFSPSWSKVSRYMVSDRWMIITWMHVANKSMRFKWTHTHIHIIPIACKPCH